MDARVRYRAVTCALALALPLGAIAQPAVTPMDPAPEGYQWIQLASIASGSAVEDFNALVAPDLVVGDHLLMPLVTTPGSYSVDLFTDGHIEYDDGEDGSRQTAYGWAWDTSAAAWHAESFDYVANNIAPVGGEMFETALLLNAPMTAIDLRDHFADGEGDTMTFSLTSGTPPTGLSLFAGIISGTPSVEDETGVTLVYTANDGYGGTDTWSVFFRPLDTLPASDCTTDLTTQTDCELAFGSDFNNSVVFDVTNTYSETIAADSVISQSPLASAEMAPFSTVALVVSAGACDPSGAIFASGSFADGTFADGTFAGCSVPGSTEVPNVIGEASAAAADAILEAEGADLGSVTARCSAEPEDEVVGQSPAPGTLVEEDSLVDLLVSNGVECASSGGNGVRLRGLRMRGL
jgi:hypothetical protein